ncbi:MAG: hypothetical protein EPN93_20055 [Spirochaetes bacterium]|nr:MAG: hypothetical protein EPN93_20055 [Spirochaetota bacterium]
MPVTMGGMASGMDTDGIIKKLVEVEARPIYQWQAEKETFNQRKQALGKLGTVLSKVSDASKDLYGFRAQYNEKKAITDDPGALEVIASRHAQPGERAIQVDEIAAAHKITTDPVASDQKLSAGKFKIEVNGVSHAVKFRGGTLKALQEQLDADATDIVSTSIVNTSEDKQLLTVESKSPGKKGEIRLSGERDILYESGLVKGAKEGDNEKVAMVFDARYFVPYAGEAKIPQNTGNLDLDKDGKFVKLTGLLWREYLLPAEIAVKKNSLLEVAVEYAVAQGREKDEALPFKLEVGPEEKTIIKGIELQGYNVSRIRPLDKKEPQKQVTDLLGVGVVSVDAQKNTREEKLYPIEKNFKGRMEIPVGRDFQDKKITKVIFYCNEGDAKFADAAFLTPIDTTGLLEPKNVISKPADAKLKVDGVDITRDRNEGLNDVVKGLTLNLKGKTVKPVHVKVEHDSEKAVQKIKQFVEAYNAYIDYDRQLTKAEKVDKVGAYQANKDKNGIFMGDMTILRLENSLRATVNGAYPGRTEKPIKLFTQMGISTGAVNSAWETIREGKLVVDEGSLASTIRERPDAVEEFFGSDTDGDNRIDNGMAFAVENLLKPYVSTGKNLIASKMDLEDSSIKSADDRIARKQEHLKKYEEKLRKKFASMEQSISGAKSQGDWMKNQMKAGEGGN